ncbi:LAETG motif-containing sortase-dependent surface protein [Streptomyces ipomoeae]|uniref:LAETG motif-containing sortase-dependent surface protein n=1 Tax=Streptomyces ipomoeae TaxID=103232 RepID=UPI0029A60082|nr:LAETG motif-containing sortase-dependent surface protein [Streptomyces ipomoeae]MDX2826705.1 LAETG motif-containing sortase-dependent surface protein [Streptomyces ipomoeae]
MGTIARALQGPHVPDWATTGRIVFALDGDLADTGSDTPIGLIAGVAAALAAAGGTLMWWMRRRKAAQE